MEDNPVDTARFAGHERRTPAGVGPNGRHHGVKSMLEEQDEERKIVDPPRTIWLVHASGDEHCYWLYPSYEDARAGLIATVTEWSEPYDDIDLPAADATDYEWTHVLDRHNWYFYLKELPLPAEAG
jgi:hypothetical protein